MRRLYQFLAGILALSSSFGASLLHAESYWKCVRQISYL